ncbi:MULTISPECIES: hypothetical protein [unclassified Prochlorococcus]|nr:MULTISPECIES: hypothetical protein [unclassified Prochlorococcus]
MDAAIVWGPLPAQYGMVFGDALEGVLNSCQRAVLRPARISFN